MNEAEHQVQPEEVAHPESAELAETTEPVEAQEAEAEAAPAEEAQEEKPKKKGGFQRRIDELTRKQYEAQQQAQAERQRREALEQQLMQQRMQQQGQIPFPQLADYEYDEGRYQQAVGQWHQAQRQAEAQAHQAEMQRQQQAEMQRQQTMHMHQKTMEAVEKYPDYMLKVHDPNLPSLAQINPAAFQTVVQSEMMGDVAYYLANNPAEVYEFADLDPLSAVKKVALLEAKLSAKPVTTQTPPPPPPTRVGSNSGTEPDPSRMTTDEWMAWRNKQVNS